MCRKPRGQVLQKTSGSGLEISGVVNLKKHKKTKHRWGQVLSYDIPPFTTRLMVAGTGSCMQSCKVERGVGATSGAPRGGHRGGSGCGEWAIEAVVCGWVRARSAVGSRLGRGVRSHCGSGGTQQKLDLHGLVRKLYLSCFCPVQYTSGKW